MKVAGIIAEYNPFHNGHLYQITQTRKETNCDYVIVLMSGSFSQRGTPTICDKFLRAEMALKNGADLVLELPVPFATASAEFFALYGVSSLQASGIVDILSFGSECGSIALLDEVAELMCHPPLELNTTIKTYLKEGLSFPRAREKAIVEYLNNTSRASNALISLIQSPNNILGIEYLKALKVLNSSIVPFTIERRGSGYHDEHIQSSIASATAIRKQLLTGATTYQNCMPDSAASLLQKVKPLDQGKLHHFVQFKLMFSPKDSLYSLWDVPPSLIHSLVNTAHACSSYESLVSTVTSKTYTRSTVQRTILRSLLNIETTTLLSPLASKQVPYLRVLGCKKESTPLLKALKTNSSVPVITNLGKQWSSLDSDCLSLLNYEIAATKLYHTLYNTPEKINQDFTDPFLIC